MIPTQSLFPDGLLDLLERAGKRGATRSQLSQGFSRAESEAFISELLARHQIIKIGTSAKPRFVLSKLCDALELARLLIEAKAIPGTAMVFSKNELAAGCANEVVKKMDEAINSLMAEWKLFRIERGKSAYYLHAASIRPLLQPSVQKKSVKRTRASRLPAPAALPALELQTPAVPSNRILDAYRELTRETGFSDVLISELQQRAGVETDVLAPWLIQESRTGRALPTRGDWSIADAEARAAAIKISGEPHLRVRFVEV